jgi:predicted HTH domain antitoxin
MEMVKNRKASELAGFSRFGFADVLASREIPRH